MKLSKEYDLLCSFADIYSTSVLGDHDFGLWGKISDAVVRGLVDESKRVVVYKPDVGPIAFVNGTNPVYRDKEMAIFGVTDYMHSWVVNKVSDATHMFGSDVVLAVASDYSEQRDKVRQKYSRPNGSLNTDALIDRLVDLGECTGKTKVCKKCEANIQHIRDLDKEVKELRDRKLVRFGKEDYWIWQGDGYDFPESLACPVVMSADTLRGILRKTGQSDAINSGFDGPDPLNR